MLGNIWISSALVVVTIFSTGALWKSLSDIKETKQLQEHYEIISEIKTLLAKQYNKNPKDITRDEIIVHLPNGQNWEKVLLLDRDKSSAISNKSLINKDGYIEISEDEKLKLLALKAKLKYLTDVNSITPENGKYIFEIGKSEKNAVVQDLEIQKSVDKAIHALSQDILYTSTSSKSFVLNSVLENFTPYEKFHFTFLKENETSISEDVLKERQQAYFKQKIKEKLYKNESSIETRLYKELESLL
ncbi:hypothetical protein ACBT_2225 [Aliarcobacter cibarius]|uniref:Uncharacterized protein n=1 Tax=Aliarcobacter cibarius TaxID=255507 RepID=A0A7L5JSF7_9BACT|nr:hypothetical protein [Aliarcobacter cibarius]QKJ28105.1 hypothetical protein ACBT_2225 [Aliarcobacter cibarius]